MAQEILSWKPQGPSLLTRVDSTGRTPLHFAVIYGRFHTVRLFLNDITSAEQVGISDNHGLFPVHVAATAYDQGTK
jgi:ankyrin repeat protein